MDIGGYYNGGYFFNGINGYYNGGYSINGYWWLLQWRLFY